MKNLRFDKNDIPVLSRLEIEKRSERMLKFFDESCLIEPQATPLGTISTYLKDEHNVNFVFGTDLGKSPEGYQYRGRFHIPTKTIYIDRSLGWNDPRFNFTLAHEIAHFVLHRRIKKSIVKNEKDYEITDTNRDLILDHLQSDNPREWVEWQANKFASSLLLPITTIGKAVLIKQKEMGINRRLGQMGYSIRCTFDIIMYYVGTKIKLSRCWQRLSSKYSGIQYIFF